LGGRNAPGKGRQPEEERGCTEGKAPAKKRRKKPDTRTWRERQADWEERAAKLDTVTTQAVTRARRALRKQAGYFPSKGRPSSPERSPKEHGTVRIPKRGAGGRGP